MDILRKELTAFYESQKLGEEILNYALLSEWQSRIREAAQLDNDCRVITDAAADRCYIYGRYFPRILGLTDSPDYAIETDSSDEDEIYLRIHPEDLVEKRMLEYEFFKFTDGLVIPEKLCYKATCHLRMKDREGDYIFIDNSTRLLQLSFKGKAWLILCCYSLSPIQEPFDGIAPKIINMNSGHIKSLRLTEKRSRVLTEREKEILMLIKNGKLSKEIADMLGISVHTVNRHRQNILEKLSVGNSMEAVSAAIMMKLL